MTREEYIRELRARISHLPREEQEAALSYYMEYLEDASDKSMDEIISELGTPQEVAERIIAECVQSKRENGENAAGCLIGILAALTSPVWLPLLFVIGILAFVMLFVVCILIFVFGALAVSLTGAGLWSLFVFPPTGIALIGVGLVFAGLVVLSIMVFVGIGSAAKLIRNALRSHRQKA